MLVSFVIPTYNRLNYLKKAINSIREQTNSSYEIIVSENNCTDSTKAWLLKQRDIVNVFHNENIKIFSNWNEGIKIAKGKYIVLLTDDDLANSNMVEKINQIDKKYSEIAMILFNHQYIDENGNLISIYEMKQSGFFKKGQGFNYFANGVDNRPCAIAMSKKDVEYLNYYNEIFELTSSDSELIQKLSIIGNIYFVNDNNFMCSNRIWTGSLTTNKLLTNKWHEEIELWCNNMMSFTKEHINYDFANNKKNIIFSNYYSAIVNNLKYEKRFELRKSLKKMPLTIKKTKFDILKLIISSDYLFKLFTAYKNKKDKVKQV